RRHTRFSRDWSSDVCSSDLPSVEQMAQDIRRYMQGLPIVARRSTPGYRAGKFIKRNRLATAVAVAASVMLLGITGLSVRYAIVKIGRASCRGRGSSSGVEVW